jgi:DNA-binding response OmpR family regulator
MKTVAIVEGDAMMATLLEEVCRTAGYDVVGWSRDAHSAVQMLNRERPDYLILEFDVGDQCNGLDLIAWARTRCPALFTIMITAWDINDIATMIHGAQPDRLLRKPVHIDTLVKVMAGADGGGRRDVRPPNPGTQIRAAAPLGA